MEAAILHAAQERKEEEEEEQIAIANIGIGIEIGIGIGREAVESQSQSQPLKNNSPPPPILAVCGSLFASSEARECLFDMDSSLFEEWDWVRFQDAP